MNNENKNENDIDLELDNQNNLANYHTILVLNKEDLPDTLKNKLLKEQKGNIKINKNYLPVYEIDEYEIIYKILGQTTNRYTKIEFWINSKKIESLRSQKENYENLKNYNFFKFDKNKIILTKGSWILEDQIIIPKDYELIVQAGTELTFTNKSQIISFSPIFITGTKDDPIIFKTNFDDNINEYRQNSDNKDFGYGILVIKAQKKSIINYVFFDKLSSPSIASNQSASGAINFYESDVEITNSRFSNNLRGDDYLNIIRSDFLLSDNIF